MKITLHVSCYSDKNPALKEQLHRADDLFKNGKIDEGSKEYHQLRRHAVESLENEFPKDAFSRSIEPTVGMYNGLLEPSVQLTFTFPSDDDWKKNEGRIKRSLIAFGRKFDQETVHLVNLYAALPAGTTYGDKTGDISYERKLWVRFRKFNPNLLENFSNIKQVAADAGVAHLTCQPEGCAVLVYSVGKGGVEAFDEPARRLLEGFRKLGLIDEEKKMHQVNDRDAVALTNYGSGYGRSHSYDEAEELWK